MVDDFGDGVGVDAGLGVLTHVRGDWGGRGL